MVGHGGSNASSYLTNPTSPALYMVNLQRGFQTQNCAQFLYDYEWLRQLSSVIMGVLNVALLPLFTNPVLPS